MEESKLHRFFKNNQLIGLSGSGFSGKDTLKDILFNLAEKEGFQVSPVALAYDLKLQLDDLLYKHFKISAFTQDKENKKFARDLFVIWGKMHRQKSKGTYFTSKVEKYLNKNRIVIVSDIRYYNQYPKDEFYWLKKHKGILIYVERVLPDGTINPPQNSEEATNNVKLKENADICIRWKTTKNKEELKSLVISKIEEYVNGCWQEKE